MLRNIIPLRFFVLITKLLVELTEVGSVVSFLEMYRDRQVDSYNGIKVDREVDR